MRESEVRESIVAELKRIFFEIGFLEIEDISEDTSSGRYPGDEKPSPAPDLKMKVKRRSGKSFDLFLEVKTTAPPRVVRASIAQLTDAAGGRKPVTYTIICSPFLSEASRDICRESNVGFIDLAGNSYLNFDNVFVKTSGYPNRYPNTRPLKMLWSDKSTRALRVLLCNPGREWFVKELAEEAGVSLGHTSNVKRYLLDYDYAEEVPGGKKNKFRLDKPEKLMNDWAEEYSYTKSKSYLYYTFENVRMLEKKLANFCDNAGFDYAYTLTSADARLTRFLRGSEQAFIYVDKPLEQAAPCFGLKEADPTVEKPLDLKEVDSGGNVTVLVPYDKGVFYGSRKAEGVKIVSDIQLYLDLRSFKQRGKDAAEFLLDRRIRPAWQM